MINLGILTLFSEYQTVSIIFISSFLTIICLATKKSIDNGTKSPSPVFNILQNDTLVDNDNDVEVISLGKQLKSKIPVRKSQILNNSITSNNKSNQKNITISTVNEKNNSFKKPKQSDDSISNISINNNKNNNNGAPFIVSTAPLNNSTPINNSSMNSANSNSSIRSKIKQKPLEDSKTRPINQTLLETQNEIDSIDSESNTFNMKNNSGSNRSITVPKRNKIITTFPTRPVAKPLSTNNNNAVDEDSISQSMAAPVPKKMLSNKSNSDLTPISIAQPIQKPQLSPTSVPKTFPANNNSNINRFHNSIISLDGTIQVKPEPAKNEEKNLTIGTPKLNPKVNINKPFSPPTSEVNGNKVVKLVSKLKKSNLAKDKSNYRLLQNENNPIKKNKKSVKFHNKVEVWARTPTFLYSEKSFSGINKEPEYYDDITDGENSKRLRETGPKPTRAIIIENEPNSYSSRLRSKLDSKNEPKYTPTTTRRVSSFPVNRPTNNFARPPQQQSQDEKRSNFLQTPSPIPAQNENTRPKIQTTFRQPYKKTYSAPTK